MSEKTPRLKPHERPNPYIKTYEQKLGQLSLLPTTYNGWSFNRPPEPLIDPDLMSGIRLRDNPEDGWETIK